ncbi:MAG: cytochrome c biogenesis protein CcsA [Gammaproteobacteria bacterium]|nr:cytochrome c biogenesis protein CcsA [Gammaproteobacteria bacterium]
MITTLVTIATLGLYSVLTLVLLRRLLRASRAAPTSKRGWLGLGWFAVVLHGLLLHGNLYAGTALDMSFFTVFSLIAWLVAVLLLLASIREPVENLGIGVFPLAALAVLLRIINSEQHTLNHSLSAGLEIHILVSVVAYSLLTIAALQAILLYIQDAQLHNHPGGFIRALPPLQTMERLMFRLIAVGFVVLSASLISGIFYIENLLAQHLVHKFVLSISAWVLFAVLLWGRFQYGWRGRVAIRWTLAGFILLLLAYFGSKIVIELILHR